MFRSKYIILSLLAFFIITAPYASSAQEWHGYKSKSTLFEVRIPDNVQEETRAFRIGPKRIAQTGQAVATVDQRPYKEVIKNYIVKYTQTLDLKVEKDHIADLIFHELNRYARYYAQFEGVQESRKDLLYQSGVPGGEIQIAYKDPELGPQTIRARVFFTSSGRVEHIVSGPAEIMSSIPTRHYLESIVFHDGYRQIKASFQEEWPAVPSPLGIFTAYLPEKMAPYVPKDFQIKHSEDTERISIRFYDPVYRQMLFYNVYGYKIDADLNYLNIENLLRKKHVLRHVFKDGLIEFSKGTNDERGTATLQTEYPIVDPPERFPYVNTVRLMSEFSKNRVIVHEIMGPRRLVQTSFINNLVKSVEFHK